MHARHGGKATHDPIESHQMAPRRRGGMRPQAAVAPAQLRATRDLWRRRPPRLRQRSALLGHVHKPHSPAPWPALGKQLADKAHRDGGAERVAAPAVRKDREVALALITAAAPLLSDLERSSTKTATHHEATPLAWLHPGPGRGKLLRLGRRSERHDRPRVPRGQALASACRLVTGRQEAGGKRWGPAGQKSGNAHRTWAVAEAAALL